jgi:hypothetical protein
MKTFAPFVPHDHVTAIRVGLSRNLHSRETIFFDDVPGDSRGWDIHCTPLAV